MRLRIQDIIDRLIEIQLERVRLVQEETRLLNWLQQKADADNRARLGQESTRQPLSLPQSLAEDNISFSSDASYRTVTESTSRTNSELSHPLGAGLH